MKHFLAGCILLSSFFAYGQASSSSREYPAPRINIGWSITDYAMNTLGLEASYRLNRNAIILGYGYVSGDYDTESGSFNTNNQIISGNVFKLNHKVYISGQDQFYFSFVHGPMLQYYKLPYFTKEWLSFQEDGVTLYRLGDVERTYSAHRWGYDLRVNLEYVTSFLSVDFGFGLGYRALTTDQEIPENYEIDNQFNGIAYEGLRPSIQIKMGIYLDGFRF